MCGIYSSHMDPMGFYCIPCRYPFVTFYWVSWESLDFQKISMEKTAGYTRPLVTSLVSAVGLLEDQAVPPERLGKPPKKGGLVRNSSQIPWIQVGIMIILSMHHPGSTMLRERMCHVLGDPIPGNLIHDLLFHDRWRSLNHCNGVTIHHPKKGRQQNCQVRIAR